MKITLTKTLNPEKGMIEGEVFDWQKPTITEMTRQLREKGITDWFRYGSGELARLTRMKERADARTDFLSSPEEPEVPTVSESLEPMSTAEAILGDQALTHRAVMSDAPRAQRGPGRPPKNPALEPA